MASRRVKTTKKTTTECGYTYKHTNTYKHIHSASHPIDWPPTLTPDPTAAFKSSERGRVAMWPSHTHQTHTESPGTVYTHRALLLQFIFT